MEMRLELTLAGLYSNFGKRLKSAGSMMRADLGQAALMRSTDIGLATRQLLSSHPSPSHQHTGGLWASSKLRKETQEPHLNYACH
jgi:hypothetical protein